jgi:RNA polymerase sigma-70 factor, ECF subfamily
MMLGRGARSPMADSPDRQSDGERLTSLHIRQAIQNDRASVAWLISRFTPLLMCQARHRMSPDLRKFCDADDVVADVWMAVLPKLAELAPAGDSYSVGLIRFASTVLIRRLRDLIEKYVLGKPEVAPIASDAANEPADRGRGVVSHVVAEERRGIVWETFEALTPDDRELIVLRGIEGRSHKEIAARTGLSPEHCAVRYHRTLKRLRALLPNSVLDDLEE